MEHTLENLLQRLHGELPRLVVELLLIALCVNWCASVLRGTRGTRPLRGVILILIVATVIVRLFGWERLDLLYRYLLWGLVLVALVVFQPELRRAVIRVADVPFHRRHGGQSPLVAALVKSAGFLSRNRYGALVAVQRRVDLSGWAENGTLINAEVSPNLLNTIFFPNSPLHDLGVIVHGTQVLAANCQFPSPESDEIDAALGSRHLAAVGMSYETDALVLVVSEETGVISLADNGKLTRFLTLDDLAAELETRLAPERMRGRRMTLREVGGYVWRAVRRLALVVPLTALIWYLADQATFVDGHVDVELTIRHDDPSYQVDVLEPRGNIVDLRSPRSVIFTARFRGPGRAIDQLRNQAGKSSLKLNWTLPAAYSRTGDHELFAEQVRKVVEDLPEVRNRGLSVEQVGLKEKLQFSVDRLVTLQVPIQVSGEPVPIEVQRLEPPTAEIRIRSRDEAALPPEGQRALRAPLGAERLQNLEPDETRTFEGVPLDATIGTVRIVRATPERVRVVVRGSVGQRETIRNVAVHLTVAPDVLDRYDVEKIDANEWRIDVDVAGKPERLRGLGPTDIGAYVLLTSVQPSDDPLRLLNVTLVPPEGVTLVDGRTYNVRVNLLPKPGPPP